MRTRLIALCLLLALAGPQAVQAQTPNPVMWQNVQSGQRDSLWNGILIGAGVGVAIGMLVLPPAFCGNNDSECATIVRAAIGLPVIAGSIGIGALVDKLNSRGDARVSGMQVNFRF